MGDALSEPEGKFALLLRTPGSTNLEPGGGWRRQGACPGYTGVWALLPAVFGVHERSLPGEGLTPLSRSRSCAPARPRVAKAGRGHVPLLSTPAPFLCPTVGVSFSTRATASHPLSLRLTEGSRIPKTLGFVLTWVPEDAFREVGTQQDKSSSTPKAAPQPGVPLNPRAPLRRAGGGVSPSRDGGVC